MLGQWGLYDETSAIVLSRSGSFLNWSLGIRVSGSGFWDSGFRVQSFGFRVQGLVIRAQGPQTLNPALLGTPAWMLPRTASEFRDLVSNLRFYEWMFCQQNNYLELSPKPKGLFCSLNIQADTNTPDAGERRAHHHTRKIQHKNPKPKTPNA